MKRKNIGVILAGGSGARFKSEIPKQFSKVAGKQIIQHTVDAFEQNPDIDEIAIVIHESYVTNMEALETACDWRKVKKILVGGTTRYESSLAAIRAYHGQPGINMIFHDAVRPLVSDVIISGVVRALEQYDAVDVAIPASDTIVSVDLEDMTIEGFPNRRATYQGQTPQGFKLEVIEAAYEKALQDPGFLTTDDCGVVKKYLPDTPIYVVLGAYNNIKLTYIEDLYFIDKLFQLNSRSLQGKADLTQLKDRVLVVFGGSSGIGREICRLSEEYGAKVFSFSRSATGTDIGRLEHVKNAFEEVQRQAGRIDYVVNSAAVLMRQAFHMMEPPDIDELVDTNYKGMIYVSQCAYPYLKQSRGQLLHFTSSSYTLGRPHYSIYSSTKAAVVNFVQALSQEWGSAGIRVNCINPERTKTEMRIRNFGIEDEKTLLKAEEVARASVMALLSDCSGLVIDVRHV